MLCFSGFELYSRWVPLIKLYYKVYQHAMDNFKLIGEIHVLASEAFKTKLCWERGKKVLRVKKHRSASKPLHSCSNRCDVSFCNNDHAYMYLYFCMRWWLQLFCSQLQILERRNFVSFKLYFVSQKRNFASSKRNFVLMTRNFASCRKISFRLITLLAKFCRHYNNRSTEILSVFRLKRKFAIWLPKFA